MNKGYPRPCQSEIIKQIEMNTLKLSIITCFSILYSLTSFAEVKSDVSIEIAIRDILAKLLRLTCM